MLAPLKGLIDTKLTNRIRIQDTWDIEKIDLYCWF